MADPIGEARGAVKDDMTPKPRRSNQGHGPHIDKPAAALERNRGNLNPGLDVARVDVGASPVDKFVHGAEHVIVQIDLIAGPNQVVAVDEAQRHLTDAITDRSPLSGATRPC
jgi:hypothetical protein